LIKPCLKKLGPLRQSALQALFDRDLIGLYKRGISGDKRIFGGRHDLLEIEESFETRLGILGGVLSSDKVNLALEYNCFGLKKSDGG
jgi:hypothetical protein